MTLADWLPIVPALLGIARSLLDVWPDSDDEAAAARAERELLALKARELEGVAAHVSKMDPGGPGSAAAAIALVGAMTALAEAAGACVRSHHVPKTRHARPAGETVMPERRRRRRGRGRRTRRRPRGR